MAIIWNGDVSKTVGLLEESGKRELRWFGITVGQVGFGVFVSVKRQPTKRAADLCQVCRRSTVLWDFKLQKYICAFCGTSR